MEDKQVMTGEVEKTTATDIKLEDILANSELMGEILKSKAVQALVQSEADKIRTKASKEKADVKGDIFKLFYFRV